MTSPERASDVQEMLWKLEQRYGPVVAEPLDQVAVAHALAVLKPGAGAAGVRAAFVAAGVRLPSGRYVAELVKMLERTVRRRALIDEIIDFRQYAMGSLSRRFGGKSAGRETELRDYLRTYLQPRGWVEAEAGKGNTDLIIPSVDALIETKVWYSMSLYQAALEQLRRYIHTERPKSAYLVIFGDRPELESLSTDLERPIVAEPVLSGLTVPVIAVPFEVDYPSKARAMERKRARVGQ